ncbi:TniQ family protein [Streptomyces sp. NBC_00091]|uniref:TniQ family protein n=1 Tax=Streptomyces sp. NBC_00091 TaxID=2975648 RepID=UPI00225B8FA1|nr:TniQ family protein [Streptomyces sp. NBC_00091]MCX5377175.1 TniQ family protein [Streptomyces sp. NBC_00091]
MTAVARTLPVRLAPLPGEALDSWLEALARRLNTALGDVLRHLGFPARSRQGDHLKGIPPDWTILLSEQETMAIAHASGLDPQTITSMTLAHYDQRALRINFERRHVKRSVLWGRGGGSQFCPDCLRDSDGRWQLAWRLGWSYACVFHSRLLADCCPDCGRIQRQRPRSGRVIPLPAICGNPPAARGGHRTSGCGFDLTQTRTLRLPVGHPALTAQARLLDVIETGTAAFGPYAISPQSSQAALADVRAIGGRVLADLPALDIRNLVPADIAEEHFTVEPGSRLALRANDRPGFMAPPRAVSTAVAVIIALQVLEQNDFHRAGEAMRVLLEAMREELWQISASSIDSWGQGLTPVLQGVNLAALAPTLRPSEQLRYRTVTHMPIRPRTGREATQRARKIPSMFWPSWAVRLTPSEGIYPRVLAPVLAASLLIIGSKITLESAAEHLGVVTDGIEISRVLQLLDDQPHWSAVVTALVQLADHLDATDAPIDFQRRRRLDYTELLPHERWREICRSVGTSPGTGRREAVVRCQLFQRISGLPPESYPDYRASNEAQFRAASVRHAALQTPELAQALMEEAQSFLARHRIRDEPVTWQPPLTLLTGIDVPGPDPDQIDVRRLHRLVRQRKNPVQHAAEVFSTSVEAIRLVLDEQPAPARPPTKTAARATGHIRLKARQEVPKETFTRLYLDEHRSLQQIADLMGFSRPVLTALAKEYGIALRAGPQDYKPRGAIEREWLMEQYVIRRRTLPDIARETGMSTANMARWAHAHKIPLRPRGGGSHDTALRVTEQAARTPAILRKALTSTYAWQRLERFAAAASYPTIGGAAQALGINQPTLVIQINRLERDLGKTLLERAERGRSMKLTAFGKKVVAVVSTRSCQP